MDPVFPGCYVAHELNGEHNLQIPVFSSKSQEKLLDQSMALKYIKRIYGDDNFHFDLVNVNAWELDTYCMSQMQNDWIFLLGDSARSLTPAGGLGLNAGVADAANLIWKIAQYIEDLSTSSITSYQTERSWVNSQLLQQSISNYHHFKSMASAFFLPVFLAEKMPSIVDTLTASKGLITVLISKIFICAIKISLSFPGLKHFVFARIQKKLNFNMSHFDGMGTHIGFTIANPSEFASANFAINSPDNYQDGFDVGRLFLSSVILADNSTENIRNYFHYKKWSLIVFDRKLYEKFKQLKLVGLSIFVAALKEKASSKLTDGIEMMLVRPDLVIAYSGLVTDEIFKNINKHFSKIA